MLNPKADNTQSDIYTQQQENLEMQKQAQSNWQVLPPKSMTLIEDAALAVENGLSEQEVRNADNNYRMAGGDVTDYSIDLTEATPAQLDEGVSDHHGCHACGKGKTKFSRVKTLKTLTLP